MTLVSSFSPLCFVQNKSAGQPPDPPIYGTVESLVGSPTFDDPWTSNDDLALLGKLREKVMGSTFNAAVFLAEGHQALELITSAATAIYKAHLHASRGDFKKATAAISGYEKKQGRSAMPRAVGRKWLANQYGVQPLLNDVQDAAKTLAHFLSFPLQQTYTVSRKRSGAVLTGNPIRFHTTGTGFHAKKIKAIIREVNVPQLLGLTDVASVAWEKLPYSFVADWFIPIGSYLSARGLAQSVTGTFVTSDTVSWKTGGYTVTGFYAYGGFENYRKRSVILNRSVSTSLSVPKPTVKPLAKAVTWTHAANAVALVTQLKAFR
jgi:hypothetical protein